MNQDLFTAVDSYIQTLFVPGDEVLEATLRESEKAGLPKVSVSPNQGKLLSMLVLLSGSRKVLEIGTLGGYSAIWMARALPDDGRLITLDQDPKHVTVARANVVRAGLERKIDIRLGHAFDALAQLETEHAGPFDLVFIDADKAPYVDYLRWALRLTRPGSLIVADNVLRRGEVIEGTVTGDDVDGIRRFNAALAAEPRLVSTILPLVGVKGYDGISLALVRNQTSVRAVGSASEGKAEPTTSAANAAPIKANPGPVGRAVAEKEKPTVEEPAPPTRAVSGRYAELYRRTREALEADAEEVLQRPLTLRERNLFRSCGTLTMLESLGLSVYYAQTSAELTEKLARTSMESRFKLAVREAVERLERLLKRRITNTERQKLAALGNTEELWWVEEKIRSVTLAEREEMLSRHLSHSHQAEVAVVG
jgi:caffeoyl-CoA O-methyltransferase